MHQAIARLSAALEQRQATRHVVDIFFRDDDVDVDEGTLHALLDVFLSRGIPLNLEVIPGTLTADAVAQLERYRCAQPRGFELHQHGWRHTNHERTGRKCEFGASRGVDAQRADIAAGKARMDAAFGPGWFPAFTPPWNRCTHDTFAALEQLGFRVLSKDRGAHPLAGYRWREVSTTLDLYTWRSGAALKPPAEIVDALTAQLQADAPIGVLLHHKVMDQAAFGLVAQLLDELRQFPIVRWHTLSSLLHAAESAGATSKELSRDASIEINTF